MDLEKNHHDVNADLEEERGVLIFFILIQGYLTKLLM